MLPYLIAGAIGFGIGKLFEEGGETFMTGGQVKEEWKSYLKESRVDALVKAGYSKNVAKNLSSESWDSLEKQVQNAFKNVLISEEVQYMKGMMESIYTYGRLDKDNNYLAKYKVSLGNKLFNKTFDEYKKELEEGYDVDYGTYTDSEGLTYSSLRKKYVNGGETFMAGGNTSSIIEEGDSVIMYFNQDTELEIFDSEDFELEEPNIDIFKKGIEFEVDIFGVDDIKYDVQFGDGSVAFIRKDNVTIVSVNGDEYAGGGEMFMAGGRITKYVQLYFVQGNYGQGWEDLTAHDNRKDARAEMRVYDDNESYPHRVIQRRVLRTDYEKGNYAGGGKAGMIHYYIGGLVSEDIPFVYKGEEEDINYEVGFHEGGIDLETFKETPSGYYVRIMPYGSRNIRRFVYPEKDIEIAYLSELRAITMLLFEADKDTKENQKIAIKEGKKNLPKLLKYMSENSEEEDKYSENVRKVQDDMWGGDEDEDEDEYAGGGEAVSGVAKKRRRSASIQYGRSDTAVDKTRVGKPVGYRFSNEKANQLRKDPYAKPTDAQVKKYLGKGIYKENRKNRSDRDKNVKL